MVDVAPVVPFTRPVSLATIKADPALEEIALVRRGRLSVVPITAAEFRHVSKLGKTKVPPVSTGGSGGAARRKTGKKS